MERLKLDLPDVEVERSSSFAVPEPLPASLAEGPFAAEEPYWNLAMSVWSAYGAHGEASELLEAHCIQSLNIARYTAARLDDIVKARDIFRTKSQDWRSALRRRVAATPPRWPAPRIIRLAAHLELTPPEVDLLTLLVLAHTDTKFQRRIRGVLRSIEVEDLATFLNVSLGEMMSLLRPGGALLDSGIVALEDSTYKSFKDRDVEMDTVTARALRGSKLGEDEFLRVGRGAILEVICQEPGIEIPEWGLTEAETHYDPRSGGSADLVEPPERLTGDEFDLDEFLQGNTQDQVDPMTEHPPSETDGGAFTTDLEYLNGHLRWFSALAEIREYETADSARSFRAPSLEDEAVARARKREAESRAMAARTLIDKRLRALDEDGWRPAAERLSQGRGLEPFEKWVLLIAAGIKISPAFSRGLRGFDLFEDGLTVGALLQLFFPELEERVKRRRHFYRDAPLIRDGLVELDGFFTDILSTTVATDHRLTDYLVGLGAEASALVDGSHLYTPTVDIDRVIIPEADKKLIVDTVCQFPAFQKERKRCGLDALISYGRGIVLLFHGPSGTGKTMTANALAATLSRRVLLANFPKIGEAALRLLFREAKINRAVLFFDECDGVFVDRDSNPLVAMLLSEIERHDGIVVLATNRPFELDEAMHRRITLSVEFLEPNATQRERIWRAHIPDNMRLEGEIDLAGLAYEYELSGGLIKNAVLSALSIATAENPESPVVRQLDFEEGARLQLRRRLSMSDLEDRVVPHRGLKDLVLPDSLLTSIRELIGIEKARRTLVSEWGFGPGADQGLGATALFQGPSGTGKSLAAEVVAYELGRPLKRVNAANLVSKWVGEGAKNIRRLFSDAGQHEAVLLVDEADALFARRTEVSTSTDRYANLETSVLLEQLESYRGVLILTSNVADNLDEAFDRRLGFRLAFPIPDRDSRERLWRLHIPLQMPGSANIHVEELAAKYSLTGGQIRNAVVKAAARAALRPPGDRHVTQQDLRDAAQAQLTTNGQARIGFSA